jgi:hypothetical protein
MTSAEAENPAKASMNPAETVFGERREKSDHKIPREAARLIADEREVAPSFM